MREAPRKAEPTEHQVLVGVTVLKRLKAEGMLADDHPKQLQRVVTEIYRAMKEVL